MPHLPRPNTPGACPLSSPLAANIPRRSASAPALRALGLAAAVLALAPAAQAATLFALSNNSSTLVRFDSATPGMVTTVGALSGAATQLDDLDFRPANGQLYGYRGSDGAIFLVNTSTGATTQVSSSAAVTPGSTTGIDFNPVPDRLRVVSSGDNNLRLNVDTGAPMTDGTLAYAAADANAGTNPTVVAAAYTNADKNPATGTTLYYIDSGLNILATTSNPNDGVLSTVGGLGFDVGDTVGFDIFTDAMGGNTAFATLLVGGLQSLYNINLGSGAATLVGDFGQAGTLTGLAAAPVPEPGSLALGGLAVLAALRLRRRSARAA